MRNQEGEVLKKELAELKYKYQTLEQRVKMLEQELDITVQDKIEIQEHIPSKQVEQSIKQEQINQNKIPIEHTTRQKEAKDLEFRIGGTWLNRLGVIAVILGLAYFLKYSFDNELIGPVGRVILGIVSGLAMMITGEKLRHRFSGYAQGLLGGGSLAIFFSVYAGYQFYDLISPLLAFLFLVLIMAYTVFMAVRHNSLPIGIFGITGGYAIPFLIGSNDPNYWTLYSYLILITLGVLGVSVYKKWLSFQYTSFLFNQLITAYLWIDLFWWKANSEHILSTLIYITIVYILYLGVISVYSIRKKKKSKRWDIVLILANGLLFFQWSKLLLEETFFKDYLGFYAVFLALIYIYLGKTAYRLFREDKAQAYSLFTLSFVFITIAVPIQLTGAYIGLAWFAEAIGLVFMAKKLNTNKLVYGGLVTLGLGLLIVFNEIDLIWTYKTFFFNYLTLLLSAFLVTVIIMIYLLKKMNHILLFKLKIDALLTALMLLMIFIGLTVENSHFFMLIKINYFLSPEQLTLSGLWLLYAIVLFLTGIKKKNRYLRYTALGLLAIIILKAFFIDLAELATMFKIMLFIILGLSMLGISYLYQLKKDSIYGREE